MVLCLVVMATPKGWGTVRKMSVESRVEVLILQRATILVRLCGLSRVTFEAVYVEYEGHPPGLRVRSEGNLYPPVFRLVVDVFGVFELLALGTGL